MSLLADASCPGSFAPAKDPIPTATESGWTWWRGTCAHCGRQGKVITSTLMPARHKLRERSEVVP